MAAKTIYTDASSYTCATGGAAGVFAAGPPACTQNLHSVEPSLTYVVGAPALASSDVGVEAISATQWAAARQSASGTCYYISDDSAVGTRYGQAAASGICADPAMGLAANPAWT